MISRSKCRPANSPSKLTNPAIVPPCLNPPSQSAIARYFCTRAAGATVDFLLTAKQDRKAALRFLRKAAGHHGVPDKITIDKSGANTAAIEIYNVEHDAEIETRQVKCLNNIVEQDHRAVKRLTRPMLGFKSFWSAAVTIAGIEIMHMIRKGQFRSTGKLRAAQQFYSLAG
jgi:putative transposase